MTKVRLTTRVHAGSATVAGVGAINEEANDPVWTGPPNKQFILGTPENWDISQYDSKGATDTITENDGTLAEGLSYDEENKRIVYDGVGPVHSEATATHRLKADDGIVALSSLVSISDPEVTEGDEGQNVTLRFVLSRASDGEPAIAYSAFTTDAGTATPDEDFEPFSQSGTITSGQSINLDVTVIGDAVPENDETVDMQVNLAWA